MRSTSTSKGLYQTLVLSAILVGFVGSATPSFAQNASGGDPGAVDVSNIGDGLDDIGVIDDIPNDIPSNEFVCAVARHGVAMKWDFQIIEPFGGWIIWLGEQIVAVLPPETDHWFDDDVPTGTHTYTLSIVDFFAGPNGGITPIDRCTVTVPHHDLLCRVDENQVHLHWDFPLIDVAFSHFRIRRDGVVIANLPQGVLHYTDEVHAVGKYEYTLSLVLGFDDANRPGDELGNVDPGGVIVDPTNEIQVGRCEVAVVCFNIRTRVGGLQVYLEWVPFDIALFYTIFRDGEPIGRTEGNSFLDDVPGGGTYHYSVIGSPCPPPADGDPPCLAPSVVVGECLIRVDAPIPPPQDLTCIVAFPIPLPVPQPTPVPQPVDPNQVLDVNVAFTADNVVDTDNDGIVDSILPRASVIMEWINPVDYDKIIILRNHRLIARLDGNATRFVDHPGPGFHWYKVVGIINDQRSPPARCDVEVPPIHPPPVRDLQCHAITTGNPNQAGDILPALPAVVLEWHNPIAYDRIVITRNDGEIVVLPGNTTRYVDHPGTGDFAYCVFGILGDFRSRPACCKVAIPPNVVPPVRNLSCAVALPLPAPVPEPLPVDPITGDVQIDANDPAALDTDDDGVVDSILPRAFVSLCWENPVQYTKIVILRNGVVIATLRGHVTCYNDQPGGGHHTYCVVGVIGDRRSIEQCCDVEVPPIFIPPPREFKCELLSAILSPDDPDNVVDFGVDERPAPVNVVKLSWWNPVRYDRLVVLRDGDELAVLPGDATGYRDVNPPPGDHVYGVFGIVGNLHSRVAECRVFVGPPLPPVEDLRCIVSVAAADPTHVSVILVWELGAEYEGIVISRNNQVLIELEGDAQKYIDVGLEPGVYTYCVTAFRGDVRSRSVCCQVVIDDGGPRKNLLYFTSSLTPSPIDDILEDPDVAPGDDLTIAPPAGSRITCLADNVDALQGWSFGVGNDPEAILPNEANINGTVTETFNNGNGPAFLFITILDDGSGVTMAAVISGDADAEVLPVGIGHRILNIGYEAGPQGLPGDIHQVRYTDELGSPPVQVLFVVRGFEQKPCTRAGFVRINGPRFLRGDFTNDLVTDMTDPIEELKWLFLGAPGPVCMEAANSNGTTQVNIADPIYFLNWLLLGGPPPPAPFPACGFAPAPLGCAQSACSP